MNRLPIRWVRILTIVLLGILIITPLGIPIQDLPLVVCDETRVGLNSVEMLLNQNFLVTTALGQPEHWNTKPILLHWSQALAMQLFGINLLALRLPSVLAGIGTCALLIQAGKRLFGESAVGWMAAFILISSSGYSQVHVAWTGDYDATLTLFTTSYVLAFYYWLTTRSLRWGWVFWLSLTAASLTKGVAAGLFLPALMMFWGLLLLLKPSYWLFRSRVTYMGGSFFLIGVGAYYGLREWHDPGYLSAVAQNEWVGRFNHRLESFDLPWYYYLIMLGAGWFKYTSPVISWGCLTGWQDAQRRLPVGYLMLTVGTFLGVISWSQTKWYWYAAPTLPLIALLGGYGLYRLLRVLLMAVPHSLIAYAGALLCGVWFLALPYGLTLRRANEIVRHYTDRHPEEFSAFLHWAYRQNVSLTGWAVLTPLGANTSQLAYYQAMFRQNGNPFDLVFTDRLPDCPTRLIVKNSEKAWVEKTYVCSVIDSAAGVKRYLITAKR